MAETPHIGPVQPLHVPRGEGSDQKQPGLADWMGSGYVRARFGDVPVLITPELAAEIMAYHEEWA